jgi:GNAT superfamily N-acetyltransferase
MTYYCTTTSLSKADKLYQEWRDEEPEGVGQDEDIPRNITQVVCIEDGEVIGAEQIVGVYDPTWKTWYAMMENGYVSKNHRGKGVFRALAEHCRTQAYALGYSCLRWHCGPNRQGAIRVHDSMSGNIKGVSYKYNLK